MSLKELDLSKLSKDQKIKLLELVQEKKTRLRKQRPPYKPHPGQLTVHKSDALERYLLAGNGWGKDSALANEIHWAATGWNPIKQKHTPVPAKICLILDTADKINDFLAEYRKWNDLTEGQCQKRGKPEISAIEFDTGSTVTVITHNVEPMKLEGSQWTHIFANEPMPRHVFIAVARGARIKGRPAEFLLCGTPIAEAWLRTEVYEPWVKGDLPYVECFRGTTYDNQENLADDYIDRFSKKLTEAEKRTRLNGDFFDLEGQALAHLFKRDVHLIPRDKLVWEPEWPVVLSVDPHTSKAHHAVLLGANKENQLVALEEFKVKATAREFTKAIIKLGWFAKYRIIDIVYDSAGNADTTSGEGFRPFGEVMNEELARNNIGRARATTYHDKSDEEFIERIRDALLIPEPDHTGQRVPKLRIVADLKGLINDIEQVQWQRNKQLGENKDKLDIRNTDMLAALKYALATNLYYRKPKDRLFVYTKPIYGFRPRSSRGFK